MTRKLKIGFDAKRAFQNAAGLGNYSRNAILGLTEQFPSNDYVLFTPKATPELFVSSAESKIISPSSIWWKSVSPLWRTYKIAELAKAEGLDIYHGLSHELPAGIEKTGIRSVVTIHDLIFLRFPELYKTADRRIYFRKYQHACRVADRIIAISQQTKQDLIEFFHVEEAKIEVIYQSINPIYFQTNTKEELEETRQKYSLPDEFLLAPGTIEARKNLENVFKAMVSGDISTPIVVVGKATKYLDEIRTLADRLGNKLIFLHTVNNGELSHLYQMAELAIYVSVFEGFGLPVAEAQACGCPVVTSNISSMPEAGGDAAHYVDPSNPDEIAAEISKILEDQSIKEEMTVYGLKNAERFQPEKQAISLMNTYKRL